MKSTLLILGCLLLVAGCSGSRADLKSPCVGIENSPCGPHRAVNDWWMKA